MRLPSWVVLVASVVVLGFAARAVDLGRVAPVPTSGSGAMAAAQGTTVALTGTVSKVVAAGDGRPLWTLTTADGVDVLVYVADDARLLPVAPGSRVGFEATVQGPGFVILQRPGVLKHLADVPQVQESRVFAIRGEHTTQGVPAPGIADGWHRGHVVVAGEDVVFVDEGSAPDPYEGETVDD